ncbi:hypothetical protein M9458_029303, partial [Cirrhinus mrigala]
YPPVMPTEATHEFSVRPVMAMEATDKLSAPPLTAIEAVNDLSAPPATATEAFIELCVPSVSVKNPNHKLSTCSPPIETVVKSTASLLVALSASSVPVFPRSQFMLWVSAPPWRASAPSAPPRRPLALSALPWGSSVSSALLWWSLAHPAQPVLPQSPGPPHGPGPPTLALSHPRLHSPSAIALITC